MYAPRWLDTTTSSPASYYPNHTTYPSAPTTSSSSSNLSLPLSVSTNASSVASASMSQAHGLRDDSCNAQLGFGFNRSLDLNPILPPPRLSIAVLPQFSSTRSWPEQTPVGGFQHGQQHGQQHRSQAGEHFNNRCEIESNRVPAELRKNPRRTSNSTTSRGCPPTLTRQAERKGEFVDKLVGKTTTLQAYYLLLMHTYSNSRSRFCRAHNRNNMAAVISCLPRRAWGPIEYVVLASLHSRDAATVSYQLFDLAGGALLSDLDQASRPFHRFHDGTDARVQCQATTNVRPSYVPGGPHPILEMAPGSQLFIKSMEQDLWAQG